MDAKQIISAVAGHSGRGAKMDASKKLGLPPTTVKWWADGNSMTAAVLLLFGIIEVLIEEDRLDDVLGKVKNKKGKDGIS